jgi:protein SCO1/2
MSARLRPALLAVAAALLIALAIAVIAGGPAGRSSLTNPSSNPPTGSGFDGAALPAGAPARDFTLTDQSARSVSLSDFRGRVTILAFLYSTCQSACVLIAQQIRGALDELGPAVATLLVSVDPAADTPGRVSAFLHKVSLTGRVRYLTGSRAALGEIWRAQRVVPASAGEGAYARSAPVLLVDRHGRERVVFQLEQLTPESLAHDVRLLESEP